MHPRTTLAHRIGLYCSLAALAAAASCGSTAPAAPTPAEGTPAAPRRIVVLGDSLAVSPSPTDNFVTELRTRLAPAAPAWVVTNAGISGDTTSGGLRRLDGVLTADARILVLELGANDGLRGVAIDAVENNLSAIVERAQSRGVRVLLCGMETPPIKSWEYTLQFHSVFPRVASRYGIPLVPFLLEGVALDPAFNGADDIHPNSAGARRIAETVWPYLEPLVRQESVAR